MKRRRFLVALAGIVALPSLVGKLKPATLSTDPNTLDDYEEGIWTPHGKYVKIGDMIVLPAGTYYRPLNLKFKGLPLCG